MVLILSLDSTNAKLLLPEAAPSIMIMTCKSCLCMNTHAYYDGLRS